jgi:hypothetical protein
MDFTKDFRSAVINRVRETGWPFFGHGSPFIRTQNCELDFEVFVAMIILDRNSQIRFHKAMIEAGVMKINRARCYARPAPNQYC